MMKEEGREKKDERRRRREEGRSSTDMKSNFPHRCLRAAADQ